MRPIIVVVALALLSSNQAAAQPASHAPENHVAAWRALGAGGGLGVGLWAGLTAFDDSINSDRKVWTTAIVSAAAGGVLGYVVGRHRKAGAKTRTAGAVGATGARGALSDAAIEGLAQGVRLTVSSRAR
jgi:hypothetical protein